MILAQGAAIIQYLQNTFRKLFFWRSHKVFPLQMFNLEGKLPCEFRMKLQTKRVSQETTTILKGLEKAGATARPIYFLKLDYVLLLLKMPPPAKQVPVAWGLKFKMLARTVPVNKGVHEEAHS